MFYSFWTSILNSGILNCGIRNSYSKDLFNKFLWIISEGFERYLHSFVLNLVLFFL